MLNGKNLLSVNHETIPKIESFRWVSEKCWYDKHEGSVASGARLKCKLQRGRRRMVWLKSAWFVDASAWKVWRYKWY